MAAKTPWMTSRDLINSVKRKISVPISQQTFQEQDILDFANEEMMIAQVPAIMTYHEEYFVKAIEVPVVANQERYPIPSRAVALRLRDIAYKDTSNNLFEMTRINAEDKAYWQQTFGMGGIAYRFYIEGNDVVMSPNPGNLVSGSLMFYVFFRPNQLVANERACIIESLSKTITIGTLVNGDVLSVHGVAYEATTSSPTGKQFAIGITPDASAANLGVVLTANGYTNNVVSNVITITYESAVVTFGTNTTNIVVASTTTVNCDQIPTTYTDPATGLVSTLYADGEYIDLLQTNPGHQTKNFDVRIPAGGISGSSFILNSSVIPSTLISGDYICLSNECIIPQIPTDFHNGLAERTSARILAALGDQSGLQNSLGKIQEITMSESKLLNDRVDGSPQKILARHSFVRYGKRSGFRTF